MDIKISENIKRARIKKGWTQEELAVCVGISTQGVSKWETGSSYPDISILPLLARSLNLTIDELMGFELELSEGEIKNLVDKAVDNYEDNSFEKGYEYVEELLKKYPNSIELKYKLGSLFQVYMLDEKILQQKDLKKYYKRAIKIYEDILKSGSIKYDYNTRILLVGLYSMVDELEKAKKMIDTLPDSSSEKDTLYGNIYALQGKLEESKVIQQKIAKKNAYMILQNIVLLTTNEIENELEKAESIIKKGVEIAETLNIYEVLVYPIFIKILIEKNDLESAKTYYKKYADIVLKYNGKYLENPLFDTIDETQGAEKNRELLAKTLLLDKGFDKLREDGEIKLIEEKLKRLV